MVRNRVLVGRRLREHEQGFAPWMTVVVNGDRILGVCLLLANVGIRSVAMSFDDNPRRLWFRNETQFHLATSLLKYELAIGTSPARDIGTHVLSVKGTHVDMQLLCQWLSTCCHVTAVSPFGTLSTKAIYYTKKK